MDPETKAIVDALTTAGGSAGSAYFALKALSQPWAVRVVEMMERAGVGILAPVQQRRILRTEKERIKGVAEAEAEGIVARARGQAQADEITLQARLDAEDIVFARAEARERAQKIREQENVEKIAMQAAVELADALKDTPGIEAPTDSIDEDWLATFFDHAKLVSNEKMVTLWARILAREVSYARL